jgi:hypothetical protein
MSAILNSFYNQCRYNLIESEARGVYRVSNFLIRELNHFPDVIFRYERLIFFSNIL